MSYRDYLQRMATLARGQAPQLTDTQPGSLYRSLLEVIALTLEEAEHAALDSTQQALRESAYQLWAFDRRPAALATGVITITVSQTLTTALTLPVGTQVRVPGTDKTYRTLAAVSFASGAPPGTTQTAQITSIGAGTIYNTAPTTITEFVSPPSSSLIVSNALALTNARDDETDEERLARFATFIASIHRGTSHSLAYAAQQVRRLDADTGYVLEAVRDALIVDQAQGLARCYITNGTNSAASADLINAVGVALLDYKAAGVTINVYAAPLTILTPQIQVRLIAPYTLTMVKTAIAYAIDRTIADLAIGQTLYMEQLRTAAMRVPGVQDAVLVAPVANVDPGTTGRIVSAGTALANITQL